jgi:hypothetical protein
MKIVFRQAPSELHAATDLLGLSENEQASIRRLVRGKAVWKLADRSLIARHFRPDELLTVTDTDTMMRRNGLVDPDSPADAVDG